ncbi:bombyxin A-3 homolog [Sipha flava]|uniref:Bombyxin A-1 n=1 Tax=Sipha flava TaxID=143950 RepID=A0A2S2Q9T5_9HEMI|nr:bombyxin A-3 homolog [Sipha flava]XP_025404764.1 bombyxin A-3 homolog [Sipha flava]
MKISLYLSLLFMAMVIKIVTANVRLQRSPQQYCGSKLADIMRVLCKTKYNEKKIKRSQMDSEIWDYNDLEDYNAIDYPYRSKQDAMTFMPTRLLRGGKSRIIDECCRKPCYLSELQGYCAN